MIYLYVKTHNKTKLKYFGKTTSKNPYKYRGSGVYWKKHIKKHGYDVHTEIIGIFLYEDECCIVAKKFSEDNNIVESKDWANFKIENGLDGGFSHLNDGSSSHKKRASKAGKKCHELHPNIKNNLKKTTSETAKKIVATVKSKYGEDFYSKIGSSSIKNIEKLSKAQTDMKMINNGTRNTFVKKDKLNEYLSNGWVLGRCK